jgi:hypothetical protein
LGSLVTARVTIFNSHQIKEKEKRKKKKEKAKIEKEELEGVEW